MPGLKAAQAKPRYTERCLQILQAIRKPAVQNLTSVGIYLYKDINKLMQN